MKRTTTADTDTVVHLEISIVSALEAALVGRGVVSVPECDLIPLSRSDGPPRWSENWLAMKMRRHDAKFAMVLCRAAGAARSVDSGAHCGHCVSRLRR
jgi:hypothetical protein